MIKFHFSKSFLLLLLLWPLGSWGQSQLLQHRTSPLETLMSMRQSGDQLQLRGESPQSMLLADPICLFRAEDVHRGTSVLPPEEFTGGEVTIRSDGEDDCAEIVVNFIGFDAFPEAQAAFQYAVDIWESLITSPVPIYVEARFEPLGPGILGSAGPVFIWRDFLGSVPGTWYASALADKIAGVDLNGPGTPDIRARFSSTFAWYFGRDALPPPGTYDFVTVVLHELGHGLGFFGSAVAIPSPVLGVYGFGTPSFPSIYDRFTEDGGGTPLSAVGPPGVVSAALGAFFQSDNLFVNTPLAVAGNDGSRPKIYAPTPFRQGSSYSHWDEATFPAGTPQSLMTPRLGSAEAIHNPGAATLGMFENHGWMRTADCESPPPIDDKEPCNITGISLDPNFPGPLCDNPGVFSPEGGAFGPIGSHVVCFRVDGINPFNQPLDDTKYEVKIKGKTYPVIARGYDTFEGEQYFYICVGGVEADRLNPVQVKIKLAPGCTYTAERLYNTPNCDVQPFAQRSGTMGEIKAGDLFSLFPNPNQGRFVIQTAELTNGHIQIFNAVGQIVFQMPMAAFDQRAIELSHLQNGLYTVRLQGEEGTSSKRIIVNK